MAREKPKFVCQECGFEAPKWLGRCPGCGQWNTFAEEIRTLETVATGAAPKVIRIDQLSMDEEARFPTGMSELDRVLGGGIVGGSLILVGGDPGIGKSTLMLQSAHTLSRSLGTVVYWSGEESGRQIKMRAQRLGLSTDNLFLVSETCLDGLDGVLQQLKPRCLVIDSVQTVYRSDLSSAPGSVTQVREVTAMLMRVAKQAGIAVFLIGHVTKEGAIAGPRVLEHLVDAVLYFEGDRHQSFRILRAVKNRFGSTNEIGVFEMRDQGLIEVANPSALFLAERPHQRPGSVVTALLEGTRPILVEVQALVSATTFQNPRRLASGFDGNRMAMLLAVLEKRVGLFLGSWDAYVNVAGGVKISEPGADLAIALALASSFRDRSTADADIAIGEVGLTGEVRSVSKIEQRLREAAKMGFTRAVVPKGIGGRDAKIPGLNVVPVETVGEAMDLLLGD
ncbi:MAG: DNA repair protein RadA [Bacillota bacterium]